MYVLYVCPFSSVTSFYVSAGLSRPHSDTETMTPTLTRPGGQSQTRPQAQHSPDSSSSQCRSSTSVSMMCLQNSVTFSTLYPRAQTDMFVALDTSFSSPLFHPSLSKECHLFRCSLLSFSHSRCLNSHIV